MRAAVLPLLATVALAGCGSDASTPAPPPAAAAPAPSYADLAATAVRQVQAGDAKLLDVPKDTKFHVYFRSGNRATTAVEILEQAGYTDVTNIGGLTDWQAAGGDVTT
jgi:rhodanese-related sulfurtransferase